MLEVLKEEEDLEIGYFQEAQEVIMNAPCPAHMAKGALTTVRDIMEAAPDTGQEGIAPVMEDQVHMEEGINCL